MDKPKTLHGHFSNILDEEALRIKKLYKEKLGIDISFIEATSIVAMRSAVNLFDNNKLKALIAQLRGL
jgi:hypothetical protein